MARVLQFAAVIVVVAAVQWVFSVSFDHDEWERILTTAIGIGGIEAVTAKIKQGDH